jgi:hypothetical protein
MEFDQSYQSRWRVALVCAGLFALSVIPPVVEAVGFLLPPLWVTILLVLVVSSFCSILAREKRRNGAWIALVAALLIIGYLLVTARVYEKNA